MTTEYVAQMMPMLVIAGAMVAWLAQVATRAGGYGFLPDMAFALAGSVLAGALGWAVAAADAGMLGMFAIGGAGAIVAIITQRRLWRSGELRS